MKKFFWNTIAPISAVLLGIASVLGLIYFGGFIMFVGGIIQVVDAFKQTNISSWDVAVGFARVFGTGVGTAIVACIFIFLNGFIWAYIEDGKRSCRPYHGW